MIGIAKTDEDDRNEFGYPAANIHAHERAYQTTTVDQSVNKALPYVSFSWLLSGGALIGLLLMALLMPKIIESEVKAGVADARASMQQQVEQAKADADAGRTDGRLALDRVEKAVAKLEAKGLIEESH